MNHRPSRGRNVADGVRALGRAALFLLLGSMTLSACGESPVDEPVASIPDAELDYSVTYQSGPDIRFLRRGGDPRVVVEDARFPRLSPDGARVAAVRGPDIVVAPVDGGGPRVVATGAAPHAVAWHPSGEMIYFSDGERILVASLDDGGVREVVRGYEVLELDAGPGGRLVGTVKSWGYAIHLFDPATGEATELASGCSASFSPDGALVSNLLDGHRSMEFLPAREDARGRTIEAPDGIRYDNHMWTNHPDWIAGELEGERRDIILINSRDGRVLTVTDDGAASRGDVFIHGAGGG